MKVSRSEVQSLIEDARNPVAKHLRVRAALEEEIRAGHIAPGEQLPAERELAQKFGVSYMTARRAVAELVELELVERRARSGTFVRSGSRARLALTTVHLVAPHFDSADIKTFLRLGAREVEALGWRSHVIRLSPGQVRVAVRALESGDLMVLLPEGPELDSALGEALARASGRAVVLGNRFDHRGVPSILADDRRAVALAVEHLRRVGHRRIALLSNHPTHAVDREQIAAWRAACDPEASSTPAQRHALEQRLIVVNTPQYECVAEFTYAAVHRYLTQGGDATAMVTTSDEMGSGCPGCLPRCGPSRPRALLAHQFGRQRDHGLRSPSRHLHRHPPGTPHRAGPAVAPGRHPGRTAQHQLPSPHRASPHRAPLRPGAAGSLTQVLDKYLRGRSVRSTGAPPAAEALDNL